MIDLQPSEAAMTINREALVVDTVNRSILDERFLDHAFKGGLNVLGRTILVSSGDVFSPFGFLETLREITQVVSFIDRHPDRVMLIGSGRTSKRLTRRGERGSKFYGFSR